MKPSEEAGGKIEEIGGAIQKGATKDAEDLQKALATAGPVIRSQLVPEIEKLGSRVLGIAKGVEGLGTRLPGVALLRAQAEQLQKAIDSLRASTLPVNELFRRLGAEFVPKLGEESKNLVADVTGLNDLLENGVISWQEYAAAMGAASKRYDELIAKSPELADKLRLITQAQIRVSAARTSNNCARCSIR